MTDNQEELQLQRKILKLQQDLSKTIAAEALFETQSGNLIVELITAEITRITRDITSTKYEKDHSGYVKALADLHAHQNLLRKLQTIAHPEIRAKLEEGLKALDGK